MAQRRLSIEDLLGLKIVSDAQISPDGDRIAYTLVENGSPKGQRSPEARLWTVQLETREQWQSTFGPGTDQHPRWSPSGDRLAFLSDREKRGTPQVYVLDESPREARKLTDLSSGAGEFAWSPEGSRLAVLSTDHVPESDNDVKLFDADQRFRRLYLVNVDSGAAEPLPHGDIHIWEFCWSPDGASIAAIVSDEPQTWAWYTARLVRIEIESGTVTDLYQSPRQIARPAWSPDGSSIAMTTCKWSDPGMTGGDVLLLDVASGRARNLTEGEPRSHLTVHWSHDSGALMSIAWASARAQVCRIDPGGGSTPLWTADRAIGDDGATFSPDSSRIATTLSSVTEPPEVWTGRIIDDGTAINMERATSSNTLENPTDIQSEWIIWTSVDGREIEGLYLSPGDSKPASAPAMVTMVHGGPTDPATNSFPLGGAWAWVGLLVTRGCSVLLPNYRGSNGYGVEFAEANVGDLGGLDLQDVLTGIDACVERGLADPERLGIGGWSYGGYMTAWAITQTTRFKAAVAGASITNWYSFHGGTNIPGFDNQFIGASPDELDCPYSWTSPLFACKNVTTPTLFLHGEKDPVCPVGQAYEMTRALRRRGVEVECAVYPREGHGFAEREHRRDMIERAVGWFSTHLGVT